MVLGELEILASLASGATGRVGSSGCSGRSGLINSQISPPTAIVLITNNQGPQSALVLRITVGFEELMMAMDVFKNNRRLVVVFESKYCK